MRVKFENINNKTKEQIFIENLREAKEVFDKYNIKFWLDWGTLLGAVRDKKTIPWDIDTDLSIMINDYEKIMSAVPEFKKRGILVNEIPVPMAAKGLQYKRLSLYRFGQGIDIWPYRTESQSAITAMFDPNKASGNSTSRTYTNILCFLWCSMVSNELNPETKYRLIPTRFVQYILFLLPNKLKKYLIKITKKALLKREFVKQPVVVPKHYFEKLDKIEFYGMTFNIPSDVENYLEFKYGKEWKIPDKNWDYLNDGVFKNQI